MSDPLKEARERQMRKIDNMDLDKIKPVSEGHRKDIERMKNVQKKRLARKMGFLRNVNIASAVIGGILTPKIANVGSDDIKNTPEYKAANKKRR